MFRLILILITFLMVSCQVNDMPASVDSGNVEYIGENPFEGREPLAEVDLSSEEIQEYFEVNDLRSELCPAETCLFLGIDVNVQTEVLALNSGNEDAQASLLNHINYTFEHPSENKAIVVSIEEEVKTVNTALSVMYGADDSVRFLRDSGAFDNDCSTVESPLQEGMEIIGAIYDNPSSSGSESDPTEITVPGFKIVSAITVEIYTPGIETLEDLKAAKAAGQEVEYQLTGTLNEVTGSYLRNYTDYFSADTTVVSSQNSNAVEDGTKDVDDGSRYGWNVQGVLGLVTSSAERTNVAFTGEYEEHIYNLAEKGYSQCEDCIKPTDPVCTQTPKMDCMTAMKIADASVTNAGEIESSMGTLKLPSKLIINKPEFSEVVNKYCVNTGVDANDKLVFVDRFDEPEELKPVSVYFERYPSERFIIEPGTLDCKARFPTAYSAINMTGDWTTTTDLHLFITDTGFGDTCTGTADCLVRPRKSPAEEQVANPGLEPYYNQCIDRYAGHDYVKWEKDMLAACKAEQVYIDAAAAYTAEAINRDTMSTFLAAPRTDWFGYVNNYYEQVEGGAPESEYITIGLLDAIPIAAKNIDMFSYTQDIDSATEQMEYNMALGRSYIIKNYLGQDRRNYFYMAALLPAFRDQTDTLLDAIDNPTRSYSSSGNTTATEFLQFLEDEGYPGYSGSNWQKDWGTREKLIDNANELPIQIMRHAALRNVEVQKLACNVEIRGTIRAYDKPSLNEVKMGDKKVKAAIGFRFK